MHPKTFFTDLSKTEGNILKALATLLISSCVLIGSIFLGQIIYGSDIIYATFDYQTGTFIIEQLTTLQYFGYYTASNHYFLLFLDKIYFIVKMWLIFVGIIYIIAWLLRVEKEIRFKKVLEITAWSSNIFIILAGITLIFLGLRFIIPLYYPYIYFIIMTYFLIVIYPSYVIFGIGRISKLSSHKRALLTFAPFICFILLWTVNHSELILGRLI